MLQFLGCTLLIVWGINVYLKYQKALKAIEYHPGLRLLFSYTGAWQLIPPIPYISVGMAWGMDTKHNAYQKFGWDVISLINIIPSVSPSLFVADPLAIKEITVHRAKFPKPTAEYEIVSFFGSNIVATEGDEWKKHRKIAAPTFSEKNNKLVWDETVRIMLEMFDSWAATDSEAGIPVDHCLDITLPITLLIIGSAAFGRRVSWIEDTVVPSGHRMTFKDALHTVLANLFYKLAAPRWLYRFSKALGRLQLATDEFQLYMEEMIKTRRTSEVKEERYDLFSALLEGSEIERGDQKLTDQELMGNIFIFLLAGHETTAHSICFAIGLLAIHQDEQEKLYQQIILKTLPGKVPGYESMNSLPLATAILYETLRLFPSVPGVPKVAAEDCALPATRPDDSVGTIAVTKGTHVVISITGLHYNPRYWKDPYAFNPMRFLENWPKDAFLPFSGGPRACVGRKFAETESVAILAMLIGRYKVELKNPELYEGLTVLEKREKLLACRGGLTTTPIKVPLVFKRRQ